MTTVNEALRAARTQFLQSDTPALDAELLLAHALGRDRAWLYAWPEARLDPPALERLEELTARRAVGEPVAYLLGTREFWSLRLEVTPDVLIPRPETEGLVEAALTHLRERGTDEPELLDLGTGSGCVALALAHERPDARVTAVEASAGALAIARRNAERLGLVNVELVEGPWLAPLGSRAFEVIVANPPYVRSDDPHLQRGDLRFEPAGALDGGPDGLAALREIAAGAPHHLEPGGLLAVEHGCDQAQAVVELLRAAGLVGIGVQPDAAGLARIAVARRPDDGAGERPATE